MQVPGSRALARAALIGAIIGAVVAVARPLRAVEEAPQATRVATPAIVPIPVPEIAEHAERVAKEVRQIDAAIAPTDMTQAIARELPALAQRVQALQDEVDRPAEIAPALLETLATQLATRKVRVEEARQFLQTRAAEVEAALQRLALQQGIWQASAAHAADEAAPAAVTTRIEATVADLKALRHRVDVTRNRVLELLDQVTQVSVQCEDLLAKLAARRRSTTLDLLGTESEAAWSVERDTTELAQMLVELRPAAHDWWVALRGYIALHRQLAGLQLIVFAAVLVILLRARSRVQAWVQEEPGLAHALTVVTRPVSSALLTAALTTLWIYPEPSPALVGAAALVAIIPMARIVRQLIDPTLAPAMYVLAALYAFEVARRLLVLRPLLPRAAVLITLSLYIGLAVVLLRRLREAPTTPYVVRARRFGQIGLALLGIALLATGLGYVRLALYLERGLVSSTALALILWAGYRVLEGLFAFLLRVRPFTLLHLVRWRRHTLERGVTLLAQVVLALVWAYGTLYIFNIEEPVRDRLQRMLTSTFAYGALSVSLADVLAFVVAILASFALSAAIRTVLNDDVFPRLRTDLGLSYAITNTVHYAVLLVGFFVALALMGLDLNRFTILAGAFGVGIGFGLQNVVNNFVSGLILLFERPVRVGDRVQIGTLSGEIRRIGFRSCTMRTWEGAEVIVPNATLISDAVTNWTLSDRTRRIDVPVGVAYGTDPHRVLEILNAVAERHPRILAQPPPLALFREFGDSALNFELRAWTEHIDQWFVTHSDLVVAIHDALGEAGIQIPFPQRDVHLSNRHPVDVRVVATSAPTGRHPDGHEV